MTRARSPEGFALFVAVLVLLPHVAAAQAVSQRGFVDASLTAYPQDAPNDRTNGVGDLLVREEIFVKPASWIQFAAGADVRANSHGQVDAAVDIGDRDLKRPALSIRRLSATVTHGAFTLDAGKQFIRWGKTDILTPTDRFAPRDFLNVVDTEFLPVTGVRGNVRLHDDNIEVAWVPVFTPSRTPLVDQRWVVLPAELQSASIQQAPSQFPSGPQTGIRWNHAGSRIEYELSFFDGFNNLPNIEPLNLEPLTLAVIARYPSLREYGGDVAVPTRWFTIKGEAAYFTSSTPRTDEYVLYVIQLERQTGEWSFVGGYAGDHVTRQVALAPFAPDRGLAEAFIGRASYTIDVNRSFSLETAVRQNGNGSYFKAEYSQARGGHWRVTAGGALLRGQPDDFLGQFRLDSHFRVALRYSF